MYPNTVCVYFLQVILTLVALLQLAALYDHLLPSLGQRHVLH